MATIKGQAQTFAGALIQHATEEELEAYYKLNKMTQEQVNELIGEEIPKEHIQASFLMEWAKREGNK